MGFSLQIEHQIDRPKTPLIRSVQAVTPVKRHRDVPVSGCASVALACHGGFWENDQTHWGLSQPFFVGYWRVSQKIFRLVNYNLYRQFMQIIVNCISIGYPKIIKNSSNSSHSYMFSLLDIQNMGLRMGWFTNDLTRLGAKDVQMPDEKPWFRGNFFWGMGDGIAMLNLMY